MIEAELKARVNDVGMVLARLSAHTVGDRAVYRDTYYDVGPDRELRVRRVESETHERMVLTYKEASTHESGSKPEWEIEVDSADIACEILERLGYAKSIRFSKFCTNFRFRFDGRSMLATVVQVPELGNTTWIEVETLADPEHLDAALDVVRQVLADLGVPEEDVTSELYTDAVRAARSI